MICCHHLDLGLHLRALKNRLMLNRLLKEIDEPVRALMKTTEIKRQQIVSFREILNVSLMIAFSNVHQHEGNQLTRISRLACRQAKETERSVLSRKPSGLMSVPIDY